MTALAILVVALLLVSQLTSYFWLCKELARHKAEVQLLAPAPVLAPDPRVDELMRVVGNMRGAEALKQVMGRSNG